MKFCVRVCVCIIMWCVMMSVRDGDVCAQMKGIVRQGVRCKDCSISCHKHCKDHVVVDCSKRKEKKSKCLHHPPPTNVIVCDGYYYHFVCWFVFCFFLFAEAKAGEHRSSVMNSNPLERYYDEDMSLKERLSRAEAVSGVRASPSPHNMGSATKQHANRKILE